MEIKAIKNLIHPSAVFSLPKDKRSYVARNHIAQELSNTMKKSLQSIPKKELTLDKYKEILYKIIYPAKPEINFYATPKFQDYKGRIETRVVDIEKDNRKYSIHTGYNMYLPMNESKVLKDKDVAIHESRHLFDLLCNPKYAVPRLSNLLLNKDKKEITEKTLDYLVYTRFFNVPLFEKMEMKFFQKKAIKKLENFSNEEKIRILQRARYEVISELNAYTDTEVYSISQVGNEVRMIDTLNLFGKSEFIERELKKILKAERNKAKQA